MEKVILIRLGEIFLKGNNKNYFESLLKKNIKKSLEDIKYEFLVSQNRFYIQNYDQEQENLIIDRLRKVYGVHSLSLAYKIKTSIDNIKEIISSFKISGTFRVTCNRADKQFTLTSMQIARQIGEYILEINPESKVDLFKPEIEIFIDLRENGYTFIYKDKVYCAGGLPVGCSGNGLLLISGGIDSPVAGCMMAKRGMRITALHFHSFPYTSQLALEKVKKLVSIMSDYCGDIDFITVPFTEIQEEIHKHCPEELMITLMRRFMMRIAEKTAKDNYCSAIITGESLGQVASQTIESMICTNSVVEMPVLRPLVGMDKVEIIEIAKKIGTYETSIEPYQDCCTVFLPKNPAIRPKLDFVIKSEERLNIDELINKAISQSEKVEIKFGNR